MRVQWSDKKLQEKPSLQEKRPSKNNHQEEITHKLVKMLIEFNKKHPTREEQVQLTEHIHKIVQFLI